MKGVICGIVILLALTITYAAVMMAFVDKCRTAGGIPNPQQMVCMTKTSAIDLGVK